MRNKLEADLGPFQTSPISLVPKTSKTGKNRAVHNFSHPHSPLPEASSIDSYIDSDNFPCTWGTFAMVALLIACLPSGSQASVHDVAEAYRTIPAAPDQWPGLIIRLQAEGQFTVNICNNFGLASAGGVYGMVADAGADILRCHGIGPLAKWVNNHIFFRVPCTQLPNYNAQCTEWQHEIQTHGGREQDGSQLWYRGKPLPDGSIEEFDKDCSTQLGNLAGTSSRSGEDQDFAYADSDIDNISARLGIKWEPSKSVPFGTEVPYLGFCWNLQTRLMHLPDEKKTRYLAAITQWEKKCKHNLLETQKLYRKLLHASLVIPAGRAHLTNLEATLGFFNNSPFLPCTPPPVTLQTTLTGGSTSSVTRTSPNPSPLPNPPSTLMHTLMQAPSSAWRSQLAQDGRHGGWPMAGDPKEGTSNGPKLSASSFLPSAYAHFQARVSTSWSTVTTKEL